MSILILVLLSFYSSSLDCSSLPAQVITLEICSDLDDWVVGNLYPNGAFAAAPWNNYRKASSPYGLRIWESANPYNFESPLICYIGKSFNIPGSPISGIISVQADDNCTVLMNNQDTGCKTNAFEELKNCDLTPFIKSGTNTINTTVFSARGGAFLNYYLTIKTSVKAIDIV